MFDSDIITEHGFDVNSPTRSGSGEADGARGGEMVTKPLVFDGGNLTLNLSTSGAGSIQVEIQDAAGQPVPGYALADCPEVFGDELARIVRWRNGGDVRPLSGKPVRLRFVIKDADLYAFQFVPHQPDPVRPQP